MPSVNQIEWSPPLYDAATLAEHRERGVQLEGYSPLKTTNLATRGSRDIAEAHGVTPAQVVIRWHLEHEIAVIPKSSHARADRRERRRLRLRALRRGGRGARRARQRRPAGLEPEREHCTAQGDARRCRARTRGRRVGSLVRRRGRCRRAHDVPGVCPLAPRLHGRLAVCAGRRARGRRVGDRGNGRCTAAREQEPDVRRAPRRAAAGAEGTTTARRPGDDRRDDRDVDRRARRAKETAFWTTGIAVFAFWNVATLVGAISAGFVDTNAIGLDAAVGAVFLALLAPQIRSVAQARIAIGGALLAAAAIPFTPAGVPVTVAALAILPAVVRR